MIENNSPTSADDDDTLAVWRRLSEAYFRDAGRSQASSLLQEDLAFEAGYLAALAVLGVEQAKGYQHPDPRALQDAGKKLEWERAAMDVAIWFLAQKYESNRDGTRADALLAWARRLWHAATDGEEFLPLTRAQHEVLAKAEPKGRGKVISSLLPPEAQTGSRREDPADRSKAANTKGSADQ